MFIRLRAIYNRGVDLYLKMFCDAFTGSDIMPAFATIATMASFLVLFLLIIASYIITIRIFCALFLYLSCSIGLTILYENTIDTIISDGLN